jgi:hypothetical protein
MRFAEGGRGTVLSIRWAEARKEKARKFEGGKKLGMYRLD